MKKAVGVCGAERPYGQGAFLAVRATSMTRVPRSSAPPRLPQALKSGAMMYRQTGDTLGVTSSTTRLELMDKYHGVPTGVFQVRALACPCPQRPQVRRT